MSITYRQRFRQALEHKESDRVPFDLGGSIVTSMSLGCYEPVVCAMGLPPRPPRVRDLFAQTAEMDADVLDALGVDCRPLDTHPPAGFRESVDEVDGRLQYTDEWGLTNVLSLDGSGSWFSNIGHPLAGAESVQDVEAHSWPDGGEPSRFEGLAEQAEQIAQREERGVVLETNIGGVYEWPGWLRGAENFLMDLVAEPAMAEAVMEKVCNFKCAWWEAALGRCGEYVDLVRESDDLGGQSDLLISRETYCRFVKPLHKRICAAIRRHTGARIALHTCGAVREIIPDIIESGFDVLNPVQVGAEGMDPAELKREFGAELVFWGGACDSQATLPFATPEQVRTEARRNLEALAPGGGYVFAPINLIQADVPPDNILALADVVRKYGHY